MIEAKPMIDPTDRSSARIAMIRVMPRPVIAEMEALHDDAVDVEGRQEPGVEKGERDEHGRRARSPPRPSRPPAASCPSAA